MSTEKNNERMFREKLQNFEKKPPAHIYANIAAGVAAANRQKKLVYWRIAGVAAAILLAFIAGWQMQLNTDKNITAKSTLNTENTNTEIPASPATEEKSDLIANADNLIVDTNDLIPKETDKIIAQNKSEKSIENKKSLAGFALKTSSKPVEKTKSESLSPLKRIAYNIRQNLPETKLLKVNNLDNKALAFNNIDRLIIDQNKIVKMAENEDSRSRWIIGAQVSPSINYSNRDYSSQYSSNMLISEASNKPELGGGITIEYKKAKRWSIQSGVYYSGIGETSNNTGNQSRAENTLTAKGSYLLNPAVNVDVKGGVFTMNSIAGVIEITGDANISSSGLLLGTSMEDKSLSSTVIVNDSRIIQNFEYVEVPLIFRYMILNTGINIEMMGGLSSNFLIGNDIYMETGNDKLLVGKTKDMQNLSYSSTFGIGFKYGLTKNIYLNIEPRVKYFLNSINNNSAVTYKPYSVGVFTGLSYEF